MRRYSFFLQSLNKKQRHESVTKEILTLLVLTLAEKARLRRPLLVLYYRKTLKTTEKTLKSYKEIL